MTVEKESTSGSAKSWIYYITLTIVGLFFTASLFYEPDSRNAFYIGYIYYHVSVQIFTKLSTFFFGES